jgi:hypothetical protein
MITLSDAHCFNNQNLDLMVVLRRIIIFTEIKLSKTEKKMAKDKFHYIGHNLSETQCV